MASVPIYHTLEEKKEFFSEHKDFTIKSKTEFDTLYDSIKKETKSFWRGIASAAYKHYTSLQRFWIEEELQLSSLRPADYIYCIIDEARKWNSNLLEQYFAGLGLKGKLYDTSILSILRHHGTPVPFLDFTNNPLIALFFALEGCVEDPSDVESQNYSSLYEMKETFPLRRPVGNRKTYKEGFIAEYSKQNPQIRDPIVYEQLMNKANMIEMYEFYSGKPTNAALIILDEESDSISYYIKSNLNIVKQEGLFVATFNIDKPFEESLFELTKSGKKLQEKYPNELPKMSDEEIEKRQEENVFAIREGFKCYNIHRSLKQYGLFKLDSEGISQETMYPNLNNLAAQVVKSFMEKLQRETLPDKLTPIKI